MPVNSTVQMDTILQKHFQDIDYAVMGGAFDIHNKLGRLLDESVYQEALRQHCEDLQRSCVREAKIVVSHKSFTKKYYLDLLINNGAIYEIKAATSIQAVHESQLLNYLLLCGLQHGKIINFHEPSVTSRSISTTLRPSDRKQFDIFTDQWLPQSDRCTLIPSLVEELLTDLGTHLDITLYKEALHHLISLDEDLLKPVEILLKSKPIGHKKHYLLNKDTALHISSLKTGIEPYKNQLLRILKNTKLDSIQWINFGSKKILFTTLKK